MPDVRPSVAVATAKALNRIRTRGAGEVTSLAVGRIKEWVESSDELVMFVRDSADEAPDRGDLRFRAATAADGPHYARDIGTDSAATFSRRLSERTHCFVVEDAGRLLHASWVTTSGAWTRELRSYLVPPRGDAYVYESFTRADARGRGVYPFALRNIAAWAGATGVGRLWVAVEQHNPSSLRAVAKAGFVEGFRLPFSRKRGRLRIGTATGPHAEIAGRFLSRTPPS